MNARLTRFFTAFGFMNTFRIVNFSNNINNLSDNYYYEEKFKSTLG